MAYVLINDITTTPEAPPEFRALEREGGNVHRDMKYPSRFVSVQKKAYPELRPLESDLPPQQLFELVQATALEMPGWVIASIEPSRFSLEAVSTTRFLRFKDDVVIQVRADLVSGDGSVGSSVHMRSKSRLGRSDFGANAKRIRRFFARLAKKLD